ncbi:MAG: hypothetical protein GDA47_00570 [Rhodospirillales bacterium]|nr:hypothetical protein [Rhodospirillales bacterium]
MTRAFEMLFYKLPEDEGADLDKLGCRDPEMPDLVLGLLFHYDPPRRIERETDSMAIHTIMLPDRLYSDEPRSVVWDDEAGTVESTHSALPWMQRDLAAPKPIDYSGEGRVLYLDDPGHDPADFLRLLSAAFWPILQEPLRSTLPPVFDGVEPSPGVGYDCLIANGEAMRRSAQARKYGRYREAGLKHDEALARAEADYPPEIAARFLNGC